MMHSLHNPTVIESGLLDETCERCANMKIGELDREHLETLRLIGLVNFIQDQPHVYFQVMSISAIQIQRELQESGQLPYPR